MNWLTLLSFLPKLWSRLPSQWKIGLAIALPLLLTIGGLGMQLRAQAYQIAVISDQLRSRPQTISAEDLKALTIRFEAGMDAVIQRQNAQFAETLRMVANAKGQTIIIRETGPAVPGPQGPPGAPGSPGQPAQPGQPSSPPATPPDTPLVPASALPALRGAATERIVATLWPGHLTGCVTPGFDEPDALEILRNPDGALLSGANCVKSFRDEIQLAPAPKIELRLPYYLGLFAAQSVTVGSAGLSTTSLGLEYNNRAWSGFYRFEGACLMAGGQICSEQRYELRYIQPLF